jgi:AraC-like DNA-binding protein
MNAEMADSFAWLADANAYRTDDLDAARQYIGEIFVPHRLDVLGHRQVLDVCIGRAGIDGVSFVYHRHGARVRVRPEPLNEFFLLQIPLCGEVRLKIDQREIDCSTGAAVMISPTAGVDMQFGPDCDQLIVRVRKTDLEQQLERQLGRDLAAPLEFTPAVRWSTDSLREMTAVLSLMAASLCHAGGLCSSTLGRKHLVSLLLMSLLTCLDHNYRDELRHNACWAQPVFLGKAQNFMRQNIRVAITPADIASAVHVSPRSLYAGFQASLNTTPMRYLRDLRLDMVRDALAGADPHQASVTAVALGHGFQHLGHFCADYKRRFGELPSETLRKRD